MLMTRNFETNLRLKFVLAMSILTLAPVAIPTARAGEAAIEPARADNPSTAEDRFWSHLKGLHIGPGELSIGGSVRWRAEMQNNYDRKRYGRKDADDTFLLQRLRLNFDYHLQENLHFFLELQDARVFDSDYNVEDYNNRSPDENPLDLHQAYVEWTHIGGTPFGFKVGRQCIHYGDNRIWGPGQWSNVGRYFWDAAILKFDTDAVSVDALWAKRVQHESGEWDFDDRHYDWDAYGVYASIKNLPAKVDLFFVEKQGPAKRVCGTKRRDIERRHTVGARVDGRFWKHFDYGGTAAYQWGDWGRDDIDAYGYNARLGYTFALPWSPRLGVEYTYASGDSDPNDRTHETFDSVFGSRDRLYGRMNLLGWSNMEDYQLTLSARPVKKLTARLDYHYFRLAEDKDCWYYSPSKGLRRTPSGSVDNSLGQEVDLTLGYRVSKHLDLLAIVGVFFPGNYIEQTGLHAHAQWGCLQVKYLF